MPPLRRAFLSASLTSYIEGRLTGPVPREPDRLRALGEWLAVLDQGGKALNESALEQRFNHLVVVGVLGYQLAPNVNASAMAKPPRRLTASARTPDLVLGQFSGHTPVFRAAVELKAPGIPLDAPQSREDHLSPVGQAFDAARRISGCRWVIVSDMRILRIYSIDSDIDCEEFDFRACDGSSPQALANFRKLILFLGCESLVDLGEDSILGQLSRSMLDRRASVGSEFYAAYSDIRDDIIDAIDADLAHRGLAHSRDDVLEATQRLLDRLLFICFCETHPERLLPPGTLARVASAIDSPGRSAGKVYSAVKQLFDEIDKGSLPVKGRTTIPAYNGELFKPHKILDVVELPDLLATREYPKHPATEGTRVKGVWGLDAFDFWSEFDEHLLGELFERSLNDIERLRTGAEGNQAARLRERRQSGVYYTSRFLAEFLTDSVTHEWVEEHAPITAQKTAESFGARLRKLQTLRVCDFASGSGAFLVSAHKALVRESLQALDAMQTFGKRGGRRKEGDLFQFASGKAQAQLLRGTIFGVDILPQAVELAKLSLWLRSARKGERVANLEANLVVADSLRAAGELSGLHAGQELFDIVIGNPPWGATIAADTRSHVCAVLQISPDRQWDSWELFLLLSVSKLKAGGRLALVLPDTFLGTDKAAVRGHLLASCSIEKIYSIGPEWFGPEVRMGTLLVQLRKGEPLSKNWSGLVLAGELRRRAQGGHERLEQIEALLARDIPSERTCAKNDWSIEPFRSRKDDSILAKLEKHSMRLGDLCDHGRGEEMSKAGLAWRCRACLKWDVPGRKEKDSYREKNCSHCGHLMKPSETTIQTLVYQGPREGADAAFVDGDSITSRLQLAKPTQHLRMGLVGWDYKDPGLYSGPKLFIRQAGVGISAALSRDDARCPQSVYLYRINEMGLRRGVSLEFVLGALVSRTMTYLLFKKYGEIDPDRAYAKLTHERLLPLPIPVPQVANKVFARLHERVSANVRKLLKQEETFGGAADLQIEEDLRRLWGFSSDDAAYVNGEFSAVPTSQLVRELFPDGAPPRIG